MIKNLSVAVLTLACLFSPCWGATYYVDQGHPGASDSNPGTEASPWRTLQRATYPLGSGIVAGDTVFVKNGTYTASGNSCGSGGATPGFYPVNSGTASAPIAYRAYTGHHPVVAWPVCAGFESCNNPAIGNSTRDYVVWDGFTLAIGNNLAYYNCTGCVAENLTIDVGPGLFANACGNYDGIRLEIDDQAIVRNNTIRNLYFSDSSHHNASCIKLYDSRNTRIYNNELSRCDAGIYDKEGGVNNTYEFNYLHDITLSAFDFSGYVTGRCASWNCAVQNDVIRNNIVWNALTAVDIAINDPTRNSNISAYQNTFYNVDRGIRLGATLPGIRYYNNIVSLRNPSTDNNATTLFFLDASPPADLLSNYQGFRAPSSPYAGFTLNFALETLSQWRSRGFDLNSLTSDPLFVGPLTGTPLAEAFKLQTTSPLRNVGRVGGSASGAPVDVGAYATGVEAIGRSTGAPPLDTSPPSIPTGLTATAVSSSEINLSWSPSTDDRSVAGYRVYRDGTQVATASNTSYSDTGLSSATAYTYRVTAYDAAGNQSQQSTPASATTLPAAPPPPPTGLTIP